MVYDNANVLLKTYYKTELSVTTDTCNKLAIDFPLMLINVVNLQLPFFFLEWRHLYPHIIHLFQGGAVLTNL